MDISEIETRYRAIKEKQGRTVKDNTVKNNAKMIKKIVAGTKEKVWLDASATEEWVESPTNSFSKTTKRNYYSVMLAMANWEKEFSDGVDMIDEIIDGYVTKIKDLEKQIVADKQARKVSDKKMEQQVAPDMIYDIIQGLRENKHYIEALIMDILMKYPYRAEVGTLHYMKLMDYKKMVKNVGGIKNLQKNYMVVGSNKMFVSRSDYKTFTTYGTILNDINDKQLAKKIRKFIKDNNLSSGMSMFGFSSNQELSRRLAYLTNKIAGISLGPAAIVKIQLSNHKLTDMAEVADFLKESSRIRGTALNVLQDVYLHSTKLED